MTVLARWRSGNAAVCKTVIRGFEPLPRLHNFDEGGGKTP